MSKLQTASYRKKYMAKLVSFLQQIKMAHLLTCLEWEEEIPTDVCFDLPLFRLHSHFYFMRHLCKLIQSNKSIDLQA